MVRLVKKVYKSGVSGSNPDYRIDRPDARTRRIQEMVLAQQFTWVGAPHIWYGDEVGMWGPDDPGPRKPMVWADLEYEDEASDPLGRPCGRGHGGRTCPPTSLPPPKPHLIVPLGGGLGWSGPFTLTESPPNDRLYI